MSAYRVSADELSLYDPETGESLHYERDHDLSINVKPARRGGDAAAFLLIELGIDGNNCHQARLDFGTMIPASGEDLFLYGRSGDEVRALTDAIDTLTALRDQLDTLTALRDQLAQSTGPQTDGEAVGASLGERLARAAALAGGVSA